MIDKTLAGMYMIYDAMRNAHVRAMLLGLRRWSAAPQRRQRISWTPGSSSDKPPQPWQEHNPN
jgi:hypothetical protein